MTREVYGPLRASWMVTLTDSGGATSIHTYDGMRATVTYFLRQGRRTAVTRTESCPTSGCRGDGTRDVRKRGRMYHSEVPCPGCRGSTDVAEDVPDPVVADEPLWAVLDALGMHAVRIDRGEGPLRYEVRWGGAAEGLACAPEGWVMHRGSMSSILDWLRETGRVV